MDPVKPILLVQPNQRQTNAMFHEPWSSSRLFPLSANLACFLLWQEKENAKGKATHSRPSLLNPIKANGEGPLPVPLHEMVKLQLHYSARLHTAGAAAALQGPVSHSWGCSCTTGPHFTHTGLQLHRTAPLHTASATAAPQGPASHRQPVITLLEARMLILNCPSIVSNGLLKRNY